MPKKILSFQVRDVSPFFQYLRELLLGRFHVKHNRFPGLCAPRTIPKHECPRGPELRLSNQYYYKRHVKDSVLPPMVAPVAEGTVRPAKPGEPEKPGMKPDSVSFFCAPTPGPPWWWDGHCYYEMVPDPPTYQFNFMPCPEPPPPPPKSTSPPSNPSCPPPVPKEQFPSSCPKAPDTHACKTK
ncbi:uncharacterized protein LOC126369800 [Pectinophora gossypiella]|uniref:uncharacterized protein LOC126369800 n=1 Tax=Pectinophora gossypiella TaxID=13191 RepID=UPI00214E3990|nr:uncharacterized protein LOC126369800 [Pectinophora gossypiella]